MSRIDSKAGMAVLTLAHVTGMVDMVALPIWVGTLMQHHGFSPPQAGLTVTSFLAAVVLASAVLAPRFNRLPKRAYVCGGFALAAVAFLFAGRQSVAVQSLPAMLALHGVAGLGVGSALSVTHGSIGRSGNPHRLFALVTIMLGLFAIGFFATVPPLITGAGAPALFFVFAALMALAALVTLAAFPQVADEVPLHAAATASLAKFSPATWFAIGAVVCLTLNQAMVFSFVERIGAARGFADGQVRAVLIAMGFVNLLPGALAALFQKRLSPVAAGIAGPVGQAALALVLSSSLTFAPYAAATLFYVSMVIFTHTFLFGLLSRLDASGRAVAATPAMMMLGSCFGPAVGGAVVHSLGYTGLGWVASGVASVAVVLMLLVRANLNSAAAPSGVVAEAAL